MSQTLKRKIKVAVLGTGGREHATCRKIAQSSFCEDVFCVPGNAGIEKSGVRTLQVSLWTSSGAFNVTDVSRVLKENAIDLVIVSMDDLLAAGAVDQLSELGFKAFGPSAHAAQLESSKVFTKKILTTAKVKTARFVTLEKHPTNTSDVANAVGGYPCVVKYDGLALGKGVVIAQNEKDMDDFLREIFIHKKFEKNNTKSKAIVEEFLSGQEVSLFALCFGEDFRLLPEACDHKKLLDDDRGPNTGGMGAYSPAYWLGREFLSKTANAVFKNTLQAMHALQTPFYGVLYAGLMVDEEKNQASVLEFNVRFGDPEAQVILGCVDDDLLPYFYAIATRDQKLWSSLGEVTISKNAAVNIVLASEGYPEKPHTGLEVTCALNLKADEVYFAGVKYEEDHLMTSGGRVVSVTARDANLKRARERAYQMVHKIHFDGMQFRRDIGREENVW